MFYVFVFVFLFVLFVCSLNNEVALFCVCVLCFYNTTMWFSGLHLVVLFFFWLFCVQVFLQFFQKKTKNPGHGNPPPPIKKKCRKKDNIKFS